MTSRSHTSSPVPQTANDDIDLEEDEVPSSHRHVELVERLELNLPTARLNPNALILGDIDNDPLHDIEVALGNGEGDLYIFKGKRKHPWKRCAGLGAISCLALGDLLGSGQNALVALTTEGYCYLFDVPHQNSTENPNNTHNRSMTDLISLDRREDGEVSHELGPPTRKYGSGESQLGPSHQTLALVTNDDDRSDLDSSIGGVGAPSRSGSSHLVRTSIDQGFSSVGPQRTMQFGDSAGYGPGPVTATINATKTVVHDDWVSNAPSSIQPSSSASTLPKGVGFGGLGGTLTPSSSLVDLEEAAHSAVLARKDQQKKVQADRLEPMFKWFIAGNGTCALIADIDEDKQCELIVGSSNRVVYSYGLVHELDAMGAITTKLKLKNKWNVPGQVGSLSLSHDQWGRPVLVVAQHGGNYTTIDHRGSTKYRQWGQSNPISLGSPNEEELSGPTIIRHAFRSPVSSMGTPQDPVLMAMANLDGTIKLQEEGSTPLWSKQLGRQFFALSVTDITGDGNPELIACSWDGSTFIFDQQANCVQFTFEERVSAFVAGNYSVTKGNSQPCLVFATFNDQLCIYYNLPIKAIPAQSLISRLGNLFEDCRNTKTDKGGPWTRIEQARLVKSLLDPSKFDEAAAEEYKAALEKKILALGSSPTS